MPAAAAAAAVLMPSITVVDTGIGFGCVVQYCQQQHQQQQQQQRYGGNSSTSEEFCVL